MSSRSSCADGKRASLLKFEENTSWKTFDAARPSRLSRSSLEGGGCAALLSAAGPPTSRRSNGSPGSADCGASASTSALVRGEKKRWQFARFFNHASR